MAGSCRCSGYCTVAPPSRSLARLVWTAPCGGTLSRAKRFIAAAPADARELAGAAQVPPFGPNAPAARAAAVADFSSPAQWRRAGSSLVRISCAVRLFDSRQSAPPHRRRCQLPPTRSGGFPVQSSHGARDFLAVPGHSGRGPSLATSSGPSIKCLTRRGCFNYSIRAKSS
jgi:hypothetical protein